MTNLNSACNSADFLNQKQLPTSGIESEFTAPSQATNLKVLPLSSFIEKLAAQGTNPALTWYGTTPSQQPERIELSGKVCLNHLAKISNYLHFEFSTAGNPLKTDAPVAKAKILFDLPPSWKSILWLIASLGTDVEPCFPDPDAEAEALFSEFNLSWGDAILTNRPERWQEICDENGTTLLALNLASLALSWGSSLSPEIIDAAAEVLSQPDTFMFDFGTTTKIFASPATVETAAGDEKLQLHSKSAQGIYAPSQSAYLVSGLESTVISFVTTAENNCLPAILISAERKPDLKQIISQENRSS
ncbi:MAG: hypothetical protein SPG61_07570 [Arcanobacterium sp.]|nr:hypothetical protein [Arcanobacterium sp.]